MNLNPTSYHSKEAVIAIEAILRASSDPERLQNTCAKYQRIFAVHPQLLQQLPPSARDILLSHRETDQDDALRVTTPAEIERFYSKTV